MVVRCINNECPGHWYDRNYGIDLYFNKTTFIKAHKDKIVYFTLKKNCNALPNQTGMHLFSRLKKFTLQQTCPKTSFPPQTTA